MGATRAIYPEVCEGEVIPMVDGGGVDAGTPPPTPTEGACLRPCGTTADCPTGQECQGEPPTTFCRVPPPAM